MVQSDRPVRLFQQRVSFPHLIIQGEKTMARLLLFMRLCCSWWATLARWKNNLSTRAKLVGGREDRMPMATWGELKKLKKKTYNFSFLA